MISDTGRDPDRVSSLPDVDESDEVVEAEVVGLWCEIGPWDVFGAEPVRASCRKFGVEWNAYGCTGADAPL